MMCVMQKELWWPLLFSRAEPWHCVQFQKASWVTNVSRGTILGNYFEFEPMVQEMTFMRFLIWSSGGPHVQLSGTIYVILVEGIMGNIHVKLF